MKFSKKTLCLFILLIFVAGGGISCSLLGSSSGVDDATTDLEESGGEEYGETSGDDEGEEELSDSDEELADSEGEEELSDFDEELADSEGEEELSDFDEELADSEGEEELSDFDEELADSEGEEELSDSDEELADSEGESTGSGEEFVDSSEESTDFAGEVAEEDVVVEAPETELAEGDASEVAFDNPVNITNIQFLAGERGGTVVIMGDSEMEYQTRLNQNTNQYIVDISNAFLPKKLRRPFIMKDFKSARFGAIHAYQEEGSSIVSVVMQMKDDSANPSVEQKGNMIYVIPQTDMALAQTSSPEDTQMIDAGDSSSSEDLIVSEDDGGPEYEESMTQDVLDSKILGARSLQEFFMNNNKFYGKRISVILQDVNIVDAIGFIAGESGANLVISQGVSGKVSMKLREIPWDQALVTILRTNKLGYVRQGSVIRISTLQQLKEESEASKSIIEAQKALLPVHVRVIPVSYAKVETLKGQLTPFLTAKRGKIAIDARTSSIIITDTEDILDRLTALIKRLDLPPEQVMIEGKIVEATETFSRRLGISWGLSGTSTNLGGGGAAGPLSITPRLHVRPVSSDAISGSTAFMNVNIGTLDFLGDLDASLALAERDSLARVISSPRIVAMNKEASEISQSSEILSLNTVINNNNTSVQVNRSPVVLSLKVTPQITAAGGIIMDVSVQRQFPGAIEDETSLARGINSRSAKTKVLVQHGQTAVIGGIYNTTEGNTEIGVPGLKDIPILGWLFKSKSREKNKNELLIFLTPRIMRQKI